MKQMLAIALLLLAFVPSASDASSSSMDPFLFYLDEVRIYVAVRDLDGSVPDDVTYSLRTRVPDLFKNKFDKIKKKFDHEVDAFASYERTCLNKNKCLKIICSITVYDGVTSFSFSYIRSKILGSELDYLKFISIPISYKNGESSYFERFEKGVGDFIEPIYVIPIASSNQPLSDTGERVPEFFHSELRRYME